MIYNSFLFIISFPIIFLALYMIRCLALQGFSILSKEGNMTGKNNRSRWSNWFLLLISYSLYLHYNHTMVIVLFAVTLLSYLSARFMDSVSSPIKKKKVVTISVFLTLIPLLFFKYTDFLLSLFSSTEIHSTNISLFVPIGISFFTFQSLSYLFDVYRGKYPAERNFLDYMLYLSFFPSIVAGPINRYDDLMPQIKQPKPFNYSMVVHGAKMIVWGMFLKVVVADRIALYVNPVFEEYTTYNGSELLMASLLYSIQIYTDFAGYSLQAIGAASMLGFQLKPNFHNPYFSTSITDFWHRWHISLSQWLKDYIYIPLGGSRCSKPRNYLNILLTFLVSGIWHGANWTFILWGILHGVFQVIEKFIGLSRKPRPLRVLRVIVTFGLIDLLWIFFRMPTVGAATEVLYKIFFHQDGRFGIFEKYLLIFILMVFTKDLIDEVRPSCNPFLHKSKWIRWSTYVLVTTLIFLFGVFDSGQFVYARF